MCPDLNNHEADPTAAAGDNGSDVRDIKEIGGFQVLAAAAAAADLCSAHFFFRILLIGRNVKMMFKLGNSELARRVELLLKKPTHTSMPENHLNTAVLVHNP